MRLSDVLISRGLVTQKQIDAALATQRRLRERGIESRLGTILLVEKYLTADQLAQAFADAPAEGFGEFGDYLVRIHVLTREQLSQALATQAAMSATTFRKYGHRRFHLFGVRGPAVPKLGEVLVDMGLFTQQQMEELHKRYESAFDAAFY
jgi:hypothetical protein